MDWPGARDTAQQKELGLHMAHSNHRQPDTKTPIWETLTRLLPPSKRPPLAPEEIAALKARITADPNWCDEGWLLWCQELQLKLSSNVPAFGGLVADEEGDSDMHD